MDHEITRLDRIKAEARQAATRYSDINLACPYPWGTGAANEFKREFEAARAVIEAAQTTQHQPD